MVGDDVTQPGKSLGPSYASELFLKGFPLQGFHYIAFTYPVNVRSVRWEGRRHGHYVTQARQRPEEKVCGSSQCVRELGFGKGEGMWKLLKHSHTQWEANTWRPCWSIPRLLLKDVAFALSLSLSISFSPSLSLLRHPEYEKEKGKPIDHYQHFSIKHG